MSVALELNKINKQKVGFFRFKDLNGQYLLTNDVGDYSFLNPQQFSSFLNGSVEKKYPDRYKELQTKKFIRDRLDFESIRQKYNKKNAFLGSGPSLHIIVVTLRCDHRCLYCQTSSRGLKVKELDMDIFTAEKVVDRIFESPNGNITIEFQGGEPLVNWDTLSFIVKYAQKKNKVAKKKMFISLVTNLTFMTHERLEFLIKNKVAVCTSLDGPEKLHNKNRITAKQNNSYKNTVKWIKIIKKEIQKNKNYRYRVNALTTVTKSSLAYSKSTVDEFVKLGLEGLHLRPVSPFGLSKKLWNKLSFSVEDFLRFYREALDYIIELNAKGKKIYERTAQIFLGKILLDRDPNFLDLRSPCGAGIGQLAYNYNGDVYTCDEGRMLSMLGDESFRLGNVKRDSYAKFIDSEIVKVMCFSSCLDGLPRCSECVYKPYCGVCPIYNYITEGNIFSSLPFNDRCKINMAILDYLFVKLKNPKIKSIFDDWIKVSKKVHISY